MPDWRELAACRGMSLDVFFPAASNQTAEAAAVCAGCDVINECNADAGQHPAFGVWAGISWDAGEPRALDDPAPPTYTPELKAEAVALYRGLRNRYRNEKTVLQVVAERLGLSNTDTLRRWITVAVPRTDRKPGRTTQTERAQALALLHRIRGEHSTAKAAHQAVAARFGVSYETVAGWEKRAREEALRRLGRAA